VTNTDRPAVTMRELRERLGHTVPPPGAPEATITPTRYVISCLPEGHDERFTYTIQVGYRGNGLYTVRHTLKFADIHGNWDYEPPSLEDSSEADERAHETWLDAHRFDLDTALALARKLAPLLTYRGRTVADALTGHGHG
jgi:hypothetical protein